MVSSIQYITGLPQYPGYTDKSIATQDDARQETSPGTLPEDHVSLSDRAKSKSAGIKNETELNEEEKQQVNQLKKRDAEVKAHEQAHMAAGAGIVQGGATYQYENGPDGKQYAVGGEVKIDLSTENTPEATIRKMQQVRKAALAPAQPSGTDRAVAAQASQIEAQARIELHTSDNDELNKTDETAASDPSRPADSQRTANPAAFGPSNTADDYMSNSSERLLSTQNELSIGQRVDLMV